MHVSICTDDTWQLTILQTQNQYPVFITYIYQHIWFSLRLYAYLIQHLKFLC